MLSHGCFISIPKPFNVDTDYGDECVVVKLTNETEPKLWLTLSSSYHEP